jgi:hypothetical protein
MALITIRCRACLKESSLDYNDVENLSVTKCDHDCGSEFVWKYTSLPPELGVSLLPIGADIVMGNIPKKAIGDA